MSDFPILARSVHGKRLVYLDNAATSQKPQQVIDAMSKYYSLNNANVARGVHSLAEESTLLYEEARKKVASFLHVKDRQVVFTSGATDSLNFVANWALSFLKKGDEILVSVLEHHANIVPWQVIAEKTGAKIIFVDATDDYSFDMDDYDKKLTTKTKVVAITHASNVTGTVTPLKEVIGRAHDVGAKVVVDGAQAVGHFPVDLSMIKPDFYAFSAHKMFGPQGLGVLVIAEDLLEALPPFRFGGGMISKVSQDGFELGEIPQRFEAGTPNVGGAIGLHAAIDYISQQKIHKIHDQELKLTQHCWNSLKKIEGVTLYGPDPNKVTNRAGIVSFDIEGVHPHDVAQVLDEHGVAIRSGMHCAMPLHDVIGVPAVNRASFALYNTVADVDVLIEAVKDAIKLFGDTRA